MNTPARCISIILLPLFLQTSGCGDHTESATPNILLIIADDMGLQTSAYGDPYIKTPGLDKLAALGTRFVSAYVTQASCSASRSSIFTGLYPHQNGQIGLAHLGFSMKLGLRTLEEELGDLGYYTAMLGKIHVTKPEGWRWDTKAYEEQRVPALVTSLDGTTAERPVAAVQRPAIAFSAIDQVRAASEEVGKPWFLVLSLFDPHRPFFRQIEGLPEAPLMPAQVGPFSFLPESLRLSDKTETEVAGYYNGVQRVDWMVARVLEHLDAESITEKTAVFFLGDHGPPFQRAKTTNYEAGVKVPMIAVLPNVKQPLVSDALVSAMDLYPTIVELAGGQVVEGLQGLSLLPLLHDRGGGREAVFSESTYHTPAPLKLGRSVRMGEFRLTHVPMQAEARRIAASSIGPGDALNAMLAQPEWQLFDVRNDPDCHTNLAGHQDYVQIEQRMRRTLLSWMEMTDDPVLDPQQRQMLIEDMVELASGRTGTHYWRAIGRHK